jgi:endothelin-converting enzyme
LDPSDLQRYYENLTISNFNHFDNGRAYKKFRSERGWHDLLLPFDRRRWTMTPPTVNAQFKSVHNSITFPAGIMHEPVFSLDLPEYVSYGSFGSIAGHELTHGFDNSGSKYDETGRLADWWDNKTVSNFKTRADCFVEQYSKFVLPGVSGELLHINGNLTLGENIADAGGISASFAAWQKRDKVDPNPLLPGLEQFSKEQLFFISYANYRCDKPRRAQLVKRILTNEHSPDEIRILGTVANSRGFREAFKCRIKEPTCELW